MISIGIIVAASVCAFVTFALFPWWRGFKRRQQIIDRIPGPKALPIFGNILSLPSGANDFYFYLESLSTKYFSGGLFRIWLGFHPFIAIYNADIAEVIFKSSKQITKSMTYNTQHLWLKTGLLNSTGPKWFARRKLLTPAFHFKILEEFVSIFNEQAEILMNILDKRCDEGEFDVQPYVTRCTLDIICETAMGQTVNAQVETDSAYVKAVCRISDLILERIKSPWLWPVSTLRLFGQGREFYKCIDILHAFTRNVIHDRGLQFDKYYNSNKINENENKTETEGGDISTEDEPFVRPVGFGKRMAFLDLLLSAAKKDPNLKAGDIQEEVDTFMFEGHDTTASSITWFLYIIGIYPEIQHKLQQEQDLIFDGSERHVTTEDINRMNYLECVIKETLRVLPTVPLFGREMSEDLTIGDYTFTKGASIIFLSVPYHRNPDHFADPEKFDPDRWLNMAEGRHPFAYIPFSAGFRNCIGQKFALLEEKVLLSHILRRFQVTYARKGEPKRNGSMVLRPVDGLHILLKRRTSE